MQALAKIWSQARRICFKNETGATVFTRISKDENENTKNIHEIIPVEPCVLWKRDDWDAMDHNYDAWI